MRVFLLTSSLLLYLFFLPGSHISSVYGQKIRFADPQKESKESQKKIIKKNRIKERRRKQLMRKRGLGERKKEKRSLRAERKNKNKSEDFLDQILTNKKQVSPDEKRNAYMRDRQNSKAKSRERGRMKRSKVKKRKPSRGG